MKHVMQVKVPVSSAKHNHLSLFGKVQNRTCDLG